jgi:hypothetical protein
MKLLSGREKQMIRDADVNLRIRYRSHKNRDDFDKRPKKERSDSLAKAWGLI